MYIYIYRGAKIEKRGAELLKNFGFVWLHLVALGCSGIGLLRICKADFKKKATRQPKKRVKSKK